MFTKPPIIAETSKRAVKFFVFGYGNKNTRRTILICPWFNCRSSRSTNQNKIVAKAWMLINHKWLQNCMVNNSAWNNTARNELRKVDCDSFGIQQYLYSTQLRSQFWAPADHGQHFLDNYQQVQAKNQTSCSANVRNELALIKFRKLKCASTHHRINFFLFVHKCFNSR